MSTNYRYFLKAREILDSRGNPTRRSPDVILCQRRNGPPPPVPFPVPATGEHESPSNSATANKAPLPSAKRSQSRQKHVTLQHPPRPSRVKNPSTSWAIDKDQLGPRREPKTKSSSAAQNAPYSPVFALAQPPKPAAEVTGPAYSSYWAGTQRQGPARSHGQRHQWRRAFGCSPSISRNS